MSRNSMFRSQPTGTVAMWSLQVATAALCIGLGAAALAQEPSMADRAGSSASSALTKTGHAIHRGASKTADAVEGGASAAGHAIHRGASATGDAVSSGADKASAAVKRGAHRAKHAMTPASSSSAP